MADQGYSELPFSEGEFEVRLAATREEVEAAQALRYRSFFGRAGVSPSPALATVGRDFDAYDEFCEHLVVIHRKTGRIVGYYRLILRENAEQGIGFYSASEFDLSPLLANEGLLELGRLCIDPAYRKAYIFGLLLRGLAAYVGTHQIRYLFGCASNHGTDPDEYARALKSLYEHNLAPEHLRARSLPGLYEPLLRAHEAPDQRSLEPLLDFYLGLGDGAYVSDVLFIDRVMECIDLLLVVDTESLLAKVATHFLRRHNAR